MTTTTAVSASLPPSRPRTVFDATRRRLPPPPPPRSNNRVLVVLVGVLLMLAAAGAATAYVFGAGTAFASKVSTQSNGKSAPQYAKLPAMTFSFADGRIMRRLSLRVLLELDPSVETKSIDTVTPRIISGINMQMSGVLSSELVGAGGTRFVKDAVTTVANRELQPVRVRQVLVQEMLVQ